MKKFIKLKSLLSLFLVLAISVTSNGVLAASENNEQSLLFSNNDVISIVTIDTNSKKKKVEFKSKAIQEGVVLNEIIDESQNSHEVNTTLQLSENKKYSYRLLYTKSDPVQVDAEEDALVADETEDMSGSIDMELLIEFDIRDLKTTNQDKAGKNEYEGVYNLENTDIISRLGMQRSSKVVGLDLSSDNATLKKPSDYVPNDNTQFKFGIDIAIKPAAGFTTNRVVTLTIPKGFAVEKGSLEQLSGKSFKSVNVDYSGHYDNSTKKFEWNEPNLPTIVTFELEDVVGDEGMVPQGLSISIYQDFEYINKNGVVPNSDYKFEINSNMTTIPNDPNHIDSFTLSVPFTAVGLKLTPLGSSGIAVSQVNGVSAFTVNNSFKLIPYNNNNLYGLAYPVKFPGVQYSFNISKDPSAIAIDKYIVEIPIPEGYKFVNNSYSLYASRGGQNGANLNINQASTQKWLTEIEGNKLKLELDSSFAAGLLKNSNTIGAKAAQLNLTLIRVDAFGNPLDRATNDVIPFNVDKETLMSSAQIKYTTEAEGSKTSENGDRIQLSYEPNSMKYQVQLNNLDVIKTSPGRLVMKFDSTSSTNNKLLKDVEVTYTYIGTDKLKAPIIPVSLFANEPQTDVKAEISYTYLTTSGLTKTVVYDNYGAGTGTNAQYLKTVKKLEFSTISDFKELKEVKFKYPYLLGPGNSGFAHAQFDFDTQRGVTSNNDLESFQVKSEVMINGQKMTDALYNKTAEIKLIPNKQIINANVDKKDSGNNPANAPVTKVVSGPYASGNLNVSLYYPAINNPRLEISGGTTIDTGLQFAKDFSISGATGIVEYTLSNDPSVVHTVNFTDGTRTAFPGVNIQAGIVITNLSIIPNGLDDNSTKTDLKWNLYFENDIVPSHYYTESNGEVSSVAISNRKTYAISARMLDGATILQIGNGGTTLTFDALVQSLDFYNNHNYSSVEVMVERNTSRPLFNLGVINKHGILGYDYDNVTQSIKENDKNDLNTLLSMITGFDLKTNILFNSPETEDNKISFTYEVTNVNTGAKKLTTVTLKKADLQGAGNKYHFDFVLEENEYLSDFKYETNMFRTTTNNGYVNFEFVTNKRIEKIAPNKGLLEDEYAFEVPSQIIGKPKGSSTNSSPIEISGRSPRFIYLKVITRDEFSMLILNQQYTEGNINSPYVRISENRTFDKPVVSVSINVDEQIEDIKNATFTMKDVDSKKLFSVIGGFGVTSKDGEYLKGKVVCDVYNRSSRTTTSKTVILTGAVPNEYVSFDLNDDEYVVDATVLIENLGNFTKSNTHTLSYYLRDKISKTHFETIIDGKEAIETGYYLGRGDTKEPNASFNLSYTSGNKTVELESLKGTSVSFYQLFDRFKITQDTSVLTKSYYEAQQVGAQGGSIAGFTFTRYNETKTFNDVTFTFQANGVNQRIMALTEGIKINNAPAAGKVTVDIANRGQVEFDIAAGTSLINFQLTEGEYVKDIIISYDVIDSKGIGITGEDNSYEFMLMNPLKNVSRDGNPINPEQSFNLNVQFNASNYNSSKGTEKSPVNGVVTEDLGTAHANKNLGTATFGTFEIPKVANNFKMFFITKPVTLMDKISSSREIYQRTELELSHKPEIAWQPDNKFAGPEKVFVDNPNFYYVIDNKFSYVNGSFDYKLPDGTSVPTKATIQKIPGQSYSILQVSFVDSYSLELQPVGAGNASPYEPIGTMDFKLQVSASEIGTNIRAVRDSYMDVSYNISQDPDTYVYSHIVSRYMIPTYNLGANVNKENQFLSMGSSNLFNILRNHQGGVSNIATTLTEKGSNVEGTVITKFGQELILSSGVEDLDRSIIYVAIPKKNLSYNKMENGIAQSLKSDFDMKLTNVVTSKRLNGTAPSKITIEYSKDGYNDQKGLSGDLSLDTSYESYNHAEKDNYTMIRIVIDDIKKNTDIEFAIPMEYASPEINSNDVIARTNLAFTSLSKGLTNYKAPSYASDLSYLVGTRAISGSVWLDQDNNQFMNPNGADKLLKDVVINIYNDQDVKVASTKTDSLGNYSVNLSGGTYTLEVVNPDPTNFIHVTPNIGTVSMSSKVDSSGKYKFTMDSHDISDVNAGYRYDVENIDALIEDIELWVGDEVLVTENNPLGIKVTIVAQTLDKDGLNIAEIRTSSTRVVGLNTGVVYGKYSYPDGKGGTITKTFKITVKDRWTVTYDIKADSSGNKNGELTPVIGYNPPAPLTNLQEFVKDEKMPEDNNLQFIPTPLGNTNSENETYLFDGWQLSDGTKVSMGEYKVSGNVTIYATFALDSNKDGVADKYQVRFEYVTKDTNGNGNIGSDPFVEWVTRYVDPTLSGTAKNDLTNLSETAKVKPLTPQANPDTATGYEFKNWKDHNGNTFDNGVEITNKLFSEDTVFTAQYSLKDYTVTYKVKGPNGTLNPSDPSEIVTHGDKVSNVPTPVTETTPTGDFVFDGWYEADGTPVDLTLRVITGSVTFYAHFAEDTNKDGIADKYQVRFEYITLDSNGNGNIGAEPFIEWVTRYVDPSLTGSAKDALSNLSETAAVNPITAQSNPATATGYIFRDWIDQDNLTYVNGSAVIATSFTKDTVFTARYSLDDYVVSFEVKGDHGSLSPADHTETVIHGDTVTSVPTPINESTSNKDYVFDGWYEADGTPVDLTSRVITANVTFFAHFAEDTNKDGIADKYQVRFEYITLDSNGNGNIGSEPFVEWVTRYVDPSLTGAAKDALSNLSESAAVNPITVQENPATTTGYVFNEWVDQDNVTYVNGDAIIAKSFTKDTVFTARYAFDEYVVTYEVKGDHGSLSPEDHTETVTHGDVVANVPSPINESTSNKDYVFDGWYEADGTPVDLTSRVITANVTFFAHFAEDTNKDGVADKYQVRFEYITLDGNGNGNIGADSFVEWVTRYVDPNLEGTAKDALSNLSETASVNPIAVQDNPPVAKGYKFIDWTDGDNKHYSNGQNIVNSEFAEDTTFTANYEKMPVDTTDNDNLPSTGVSSSNNLLYGLCMVLFGLLVIIFRRRENKI